MPREFTRARRVEEQLRRDLADLIRAEDQASGPGPGMVSITAARVSADLSQAKIYISVLSDDADIVKGSMTALQRSTGKLRHLLARRMRIRAVPQ